MCQCNEPRVLLFVLDTSFKKPKIVVHLCGCHPFDGGTHIKEVYGVCLMLADCCT